jgi:hypothetical protein
MLKRILLAIAIVVVALPAPAQSPTAPYSPWMLARNQPGFNEMLANAPVVVANYQMQLGSPLIVVACNSCTMTLPPCKAGTTMEAIATYPWTLSGPEPVVQPQGSDVWVINQATGQTGVSFGRTMAPYQTSVYTALPTANGCQWQLN